MAGNSVSREAKAHPLNAAHEYYASGGLAHFNIPYDWFIKATRQKRSYVKRRQCRMQAAAQYKLGFAKGLNLRASKKMNRRNESERFFVRQERRNRQYQSIVDAA
jgi:hypothetical protein